MAHRDYDLVIIGAGIVGLATALEFTRRYPGIRLAVLDKEPRVAAHQTGHNSGVIHSGLYYRPGSLKAQLCVTGAAAMVEFCREHGIPHEVCGKVVIAVDQSELPALEELHRRAIANCVPGVRKISAEELRDIEPYSAGIQALHVPTTGITDYKLVAAKYAELIQARGGELHLATAVTGIANRKPIIVETNRGTLETRALINCAGLQSDRIAHKAGSDPGVQIIPFRGEYYEISPEKGRLVRGLIYPVPDPRLPFLGVHFTRRVDGTTEAGPNAVLALRREGYRKSNFDVADVVQMLSFPGFWRMGRRFWRSGISEYHRSLSKAQFVNALRRLLPVIEDSHLTSGGSGVRAQAVTLDGKLVDDFHLVARDNIVHVLNVPSPAATASLKIGEKVAEMARQHIVAVTSPTH